jgi:mRNA-degrading endonuclease RelE of RelBE toxin-antitoxin system
MSYEILTVEEFRRDVKKLHKKYRSIKKDILDLIQRLEDDAYIGIDLGNNLYKIRVRNSDIAGKSGG